MGAKKSPDRGGPGISNRRRQTRYDYEARAVRRAACGTTTTGAFTGFAFARDVARARFRALITKHFSSALSTLDSTSGAFWRMTSDTSEMISALARSSMRFSRNERLFDLLRNV